MEWKHGLFRLTSLLLLSQLSLTGCATKSIKVGESADGLPHETVPLVGSFKAQRYAFPNGLKLVVVEDHSSPTFAYQTWFRVGSRDETPGYTGLAHLFEHMMFKGTKDVKEGEFDRLLERAGAEGENAFTSQDYTAYVQQLPKTELELIVKLEADRMVNLIVNDASFNTEREVVQNERRFRTENNPDGLMFQELFGLAFTQHPYRWPVIGYQEDLNRMGAKEARDFYRAFYSPNHATIVVTGDVSAPAVADLVRKYYGGLQPQTTTQPEVQVEPPQAGARRKTLALNMQVEKLLISYHVPAVGASDSPALDMAQAVLTGGKSSRLHRALVETGIASSVYGYSMEKKDPSLFVIGVNLQEKKHASQAEAVVLRELARLVREPVPPQELDRARNRMSFDFYEGLNGNTQKARFIGVYETIANGFEAGVERYQKAAKTTALELQAAARHYFTPRNRTVIVGVKQGAKKEAGL